MDIIHADTSSVEVVELKTGTPTFAPSVKVKEYSKHSSLFKVASSERDVASSPYMTCNPGYA